LTIFQPVFRQGVGRLDIVVAGPTSPPPSISADGTNDAAIECRVSPRLLKAADEGLKLAGRLRWRTVTGGSRRYMEKLTAPFAAAIRTECPVMRVERDGAVQSSLRPPR
jgi:hypothetical protein